MKIEITTTTAAIKNKLEYSLWLYFKFRSGI